MTGFGPDEYSDAFERFSRRYAESQVPWDDELPPPEVRDLAHDLAPGRAIDLGCGFGRAAIYLARYGWQVDGVDFIETAIAEARRRADEARVADLARFHVASAADLGFLRPPYDLALDVGCMHSFPPPALLAYRRELVRLLRPGGRYVLFARLRNDDDEDSEQDGDVGPRGIPETSILGLLADDFTLERIDRGVTGVEDKPVWPSGWFWFRRNS